MLWQRDVEPDFVKLFAEQWRLSRRDANARQGPRTGRDWLDEAFEDAAEHACCPVTWLMPELMDLIARTADQPLDRVRGEVHALLTEQDFNEVSGDTVSDPRHRELVELYVDRLTRTIERIRRHDRQQRAGEPMQNPSSFFG